MEPGFRDVQPPDLHRRGVPIYFCDPHYPANPVNRPSIHSQSKRPLEGLCRRPQTHSAKPQRTTTLDARLYDTNGEVCGDRYDDRLRAPVQKRTTDRSVLIMLTIEGLHRRSAVSGTSHRSLQISTTCSRSREDRRNHTLTLSSESVDSEFHHVSRY